MKRHEAKIPFFLIWRFTTRSNKWTLGLTIFLMGVAFINLVFMTSLFNGIIEGSNDQIINTYVGNVEIGPSDHLDTITHASDVAAIARRTDTVTGVSAQMEVPATMKFGTIELSRSVVAVDPDQETMVTNMSKHMVEGSYLQKDDTDGIMIGIQLAGGPDVELNMSSLKGVHAGDNVQLTAGAVTKEFTVRGIYNTKFMNGDSRAFITQQALATLMPSLNDQATIIIVKTEKKDDERKVIDALKINGVTGTFTTWVDYAGVMKSVTKSFLSINVLMSFVAIMIAAITIFIVIYIDITDKRRQIGILRAIGIKPWIIRMAYVLQSAVYSFFGVLIGTGLFFGVIVPYFVAHPFALPIADVTLIIDPADFIIRAESIMLVALVSGLIPAIFVTRMKILNAILGK